MVVGSENAAIDDDGCEGKSQVPARTVRRILLRGARRNFGEEVFFRVRRGGRDADAIFFLGMQKPQLVVEQKAF